MHLTAERLDRIQPSLTIAIATKARHMIAEGKNIISLSQGEPDFDTPRNVKDAAIRAIEANETHYTDVAGTPVLRQAVAAKFKRDSGIDYKPEEIIISTGGKQVIFNAMLATLNKDDEVIIPSPCWVSYPDIVAVADGKPVLVPCEQNHGFKLRAEALEQAITPRTRWFMLNNPCNPTGAAYSAEELRPICDVLLRHPDVWIFTDDIYEKLTYDGFKPATIVQVEPKLRDRTVTMNGCSKAYAMTGWRLGFAGAPVALIKAMDKLQSQSTSNTNTIAMAAAVEALTGPQESIEAMRKIFEERRNLVVEMLNKAPGIYCHKPEGAFYVYPAIHGCIGKTSRGGKRIDDDETFVLTLLEEAGVAAVHGSAFCFPGHFRIAYANATEELREACTRIQHFCEGFALMPAFADRLGRVQVAASVQMTIRARELRAQGVDIVQLTIGEPNFDSPRHAIEAAHKAALDGQTKYPPQDGIAPLKQAIQRKFRRDNGLDYALDEICVTNGGKQAIFNALLATVNPGDESVIPVPSWSAYALMTNLCDGEPVFVTCPQNNGFKPRAEDIDAAITPKTKWLILNNPNNPTGACCSAAELRAIADVMVKHPHVWIMSDDMYEHLVFDGFKHATIAQVAPELRDRTVTISGASKAYAMTGWRIGYAGGPKNLIRAMVNMQGQATAGVSTVGQAAAAAALDGPQDGVAEQIVAYRNRRDMAVEMLNACRGINCHKPEGAFYVFPNVAGCIGRTTAGGRKLATDQDVCMALLEEAHVATVHGAAYGMSPYLRVSTATDDASLAEGCRRIAAFCEGLR